MITIENSYFDAQGENKKDKVYGITLKGSENVHIKNCEFSNKGYSSILNHCEGNLLVENCVFNCDDVYNPIEGSQQFDNGNVSISNCKFVGTPGNNFVNFYQVKDGSNHLIEDCEFNGSTANNLVRISNRTNASMKVAMKNCAYSFASGEPDDYTAILLCQDYTSGQDFTKVVFELDNVSCNGEVISEEPAVGKIFYVYDNANGLITGEGNDPEIVIK